MAPASPNAAPLLKQHEQEELHAHCPESPISRVHCPVETHSPLPVDIDGCDDDGQGSLKGRYVWLSSGRGTALADDIECYISWPTGPAKCIVLVISDIFGLRTGRHAQICDSLAADGFVAVCPDLIGDGQARANAGLFSRWPPKSLANIMDLVLCCKLRWLMRALPLAKPGDEIVLPRVQNCLEYVQREHAERSSREQPVPSSLDCCAVVGFCWGAAVAARILAWPSPPLKLLGGIGFHPSIQPNADGKLLLGSITRPFLLAPAGNDPAALHPGGELAAIITNKFGLEAAGGTPLLSPFKNMIHGWMTRGPLDDAAIAVAYQDGLSLTTRFFRALVGTVGS